MRIFLVQPPTNYTEGSTLVEPLGLSYIGAVCRDAGHEVEIFDLLNTELADPDGLFAAMDRFRPDLVGITSMSENFPSGRLVAKAVKARYGCPVVFGGWHVSGEPKAVLEPCIDYVVCGEGEETILELLEHIEGRGLPLAEIEGIAYKAPDVPGGFRVNPARARIRKLAKVPRPMRDGLPIDRYKFPVMYSHPISRMRTLSMQASRGCPYKCSYCQTPALWGSIWTNRNASDVVDEMEMLADTYNTNTVWMRDEEFTIRKNWVMDIAREITRRNLQKRVRWGSFCRVDDIDEELMSALKAAGYCYGFMGIETGDPAVRERLKKFYKQEEAERAAALFHKYDITSHVGWIIGFPWDTKEALDKSFDWLLTLPLDFVYFTFPTPFAATGLREEAEKNGLMLSSQDEIYNVKNPVIRTPHIEYEMLRRLPHEYMKKFYLRPSYVLRFMRRLVKSPYRVWTTTEFIYNFVFRYRQPWPHEKPLVGGMKFHIPDRYFQRAEGYAADGSGPPPPPPPAHLPATPSWSAV